MKEQTIEVADLDHFKLAVGEALILRPTRQITKLQEEQLRESVARRLPGFSVIVLPSEVEVMAGSSPPDPPTPPPSRLLCDACGDVTHKPHGWFCRLMARLDGRTKQQADERSEA